MTSFNIFIGYEDDNGKWIGDTVIYNREILRTYHEVLVKNDCDTEKAINEIRKSIFLPVLADMKYLQEGDFELIGAYLIYDKNVNGLALYTNDYSSDYTKKGKLQDFKPCFYITIQNDADEESAEDIRVILENFANECESVEENHVLGEIKNINDEEDSEYTVTVNGPIDKELLQSCLEEGFKGLVSLGVDIKYTIK